MSKYEYNTFILGAGFSAPAGLPLGVDLMPLVIKEAKEILVRNSDNKTLYDNILEPDLADYVWYKSLCGKLITDYSNINFEDFISFLDLEYYLTLTGENWSSEGNRSQILVRNLLARIINNRQIKINVSAQELYDEFVKVLKPRDLIITFNYDTILEDALKRNSIPYRFNGYCYKEIKEDDSVILDVECEDVILLKMHGSINWFSKDGFEKKREYHQRVGSPQLAVHTIFSNPYHYNLRSIIKGKILSDDPLRNIYQIDNLSSYLSICENVTECPHIISPSSYKLLYMQKLKEYWRGFNATGASSKNFVIIGFSLPEHDDYIRLPLFRAIHNFQSDDWNPGFERNRLKIVDFKTTGEEKGSFFQNYSVVDKSKTVVFFDGFNKDVINKLMIM